MKHFIAVIITGVVLLFSCGAGHAAIIFEDDFNTESYGLNYTGFDKWNVTEGSVDVLYSTYFSSLTADGYYLDMDGSTSNGGTLTTKTGIALSAGSYILSFDLAGNQRNYSTESVSVSVSGNLLSKTYSKNKNDAFERYYETFSVTSSQIVYLTFATSSNDNTGMLLDNVKLETSAVPAPASMLLLSIGMLGIAGTRRKK